MHNLWHIIICIVSNIAWQMGDYTPSGTQWKVPAVAAEQQKQKEMPDFPCVIVFTVTSCQPCKMMKDSTIPPLKRNGWRIDEVSSTPGKGKARSHIIVVHLGDLSSPAAPPGSSPKVNAFPTSIAWDGKKEVTRREGYLDPFGLGDLWYKANP